MAPSTSPSRMMRPAAGFRLWRRGGVVAFAARRATPLMRITLVFPACSRRGGVERVVWEAARFLSAHHQVTVVSAGAEELPVGVRHVPVSPYRSLGVLDPVAFRRAATSALATFPSDVTVSYGSECPPADIYVIGSVHRAWLLAAEPVNIQAGCRTGSVIGVDLIPWLHGHGEV